jgi:hypothetical protein
MWTVESVLNLLVVGCAIRKIAERVHAEFDIIAPKTQHHKWTNDHLGKCHNLILIVIVLGQIPLCKPHCPMFK